MRSVDWDLVHQTLSGNIQFDVCERLVPILYRWPGGGGILLLLLFINFCLKQGIFFLDDKQPARMFYELHYSKIFIYYCLTQGMVSG